MREQADRVHHAHGLSQQQDGADADGCRVEEEQIESEEEQMRKRDDEHLSHSGTEQEDK